MEFVMTILEGAWRYVTTIRIADYLDIALMAYCCYLLLRLVRSTRAESLVKGIMVFLLALWISHVFKLNGIYFILNHMLDVGILALIVLFQPESRRMLEQVLAGGCMLPLSKNVNLSRDLGMRHRAGIGMSENSDAVVVIVSEETGTISVAIGGLLKRHLKPETLEKLLINELMPQTEEPGADKPQLHLPRILKKRKEDDEENGAN